MVGIGFYLAFLIPWLWIFLRATVLSGFLGFIAMELGWITTE